MIIINAKILTMENEDYENGYLTINDGLISAIGDMKDCPLVTGQEVVDAGGGLLLPGFIDAHSHMGMWEDSLDFEGDDGNEDTDPVTPQLRAVDAVNPMDRCFSEALAAGVTTVLTGPGSANPIGGLWCAMKTFGRRIDDMLLEPAAGMNEEETATLAGMIRMLQKEYGRTVVIIDHHMDLIMDICDRLTVINFGEQLMTGTPAQAQSDQKVIDAYLGVDESC